MTTTPRTADRFAAGGNALPAGRCVCVSRLLRSGWTREYCGVLSSDLCVGRCLSVRLDSSNCLLSSEIRVIERGADQALLVETRHSIYRVREPDDVPVNKRWRASA